MYIRQILAHLLVHYMKNLSFSPVNYFTTASDDPADTGFLSSYLLQATPISLFFFLFFSYTQQIVDTDQSGSPEILFASGDTNQSGYCVCFRLCGFFGFLLGPGGTDLPMIS